MTTDSCAHKTAAVVESSLQYLPISDRRYTHYAITTHAISPTQSRLGPIPKSNQTESRLRTCVVLVLESDNNSRYMPGCIGYRLLYNASEFESFDILLCIGLSTFTL